MAEDVGANEEMTLALARQVTPTLDPEAAEAFAHYDRLRRKPNPSRRDREHIATFRALLAENAHEISAKSREMLHDAGADEILPAVEAGLVQIDPVIRGDDETVAAIASSVARAAGVASAYDSLIAESFIRRVAALLADPLTYPLFDEMVGDVVRAQVAEGLFEIRDTAKRRGKQVSAAAQLMRGMPSFPAASIAEILDIRNELRTPLTKFRGAVAEMEGLIQSAAYESDFEAEVDALYFRKVAPALGEIAEAVEGNTYLRQLMRAAVSDAKTMLTAVLTMGVAAHLGVPELLAAAVGSGVPAGTASLHAPEAKSLGNKEIQGNHLFFLYRLEELLLPG
jgi:hypothetical protein